MNYWKAAITALVLAALVMIGRATMELPPGAEVADESAEWVQDDNSEPISWDIPLLQHHASQDGNELQAAGAQQEPDSGSRLSTRRCWRPARNVGIALIPVRSPAKASHLHQVGWASHFPSPAAADLLFIAGGYTRLFQKG